MTQDKKKYQLKKWLSNLKNKKQSKRGEIEKAC